MGWDATPTWSGFLYQGKVALYHTLRTINENLSQKIECPKTKCSRFSMELEWIEDFSIKNISDDKIYYSIHQVKAYKSQEESQYLKAIKEVEVNVKKFRDKGYYPKGYIHIIQPVVFKTTSPYVSVYQYISNGCSRDYCNLEDIETLIIEEIEKLYKELHNGESLSEEDKKQFYLSVVNEIDKIVRERHNGIIKFGREEAPIISYPLCNLCKVLNEREKRRNIYYENLLKKEFIDTFERYYSEQLEIAAEDGGLEDGGLKDEVASTDIENIEVKNFYNYINFLWHYYNEQNNFLEFCKRVTPDYILTGRFDEHTFRKLLPVESLQDFYFPVIEELVKRRIPSDDSGVFEIDGEKHLVTNITRGVGMGFGSKEDDEKRKKIRIEQLKRDILNNPSNIETLFEIDTLISKEIDIDRLYSDNFTDIENLTIDKEEKISCNLPSRLEKITHIKNNIKIISKSKLKERLNQL